MITNTGADRQLTLRRPNPRIIDPGGTQIDAIAVSLGDESFDRYWLTSTLVSGIPIRASVRFGGIVGNMERAALLEISLSSNGAITLQFRDAPLQRGSRHVKEVEEIGRARVRTTNNTMYI